MGLKQQPATADQEPAIRRRLIVISGCSGGGKSTLLAALGAKGYATFPEPGRQVVREELAQGGDALPWLNTEEFSGRAIRRSMEFYRSAVECTGVVFFDRSLIDNIIALETADLEVPDWAKKFATDCQYDPTIYMAPPWQALFKNDSERRHSFSDACTEYEALVAGYPNFGYTLKILPKLSVSARVNWIENDMNAEGKSDQ